MQSVEESVDPEFKNLIQAVRTFQNVRRTYGPGNCSFNFPIIQVNCSSGSAWPLRAPGVHPSVACQEVSILQQVVGTYWL